VGDSWGEVKAIAIDDTGTYGIFVGNDYREGNYSWRIEKRRLDDLELDEDFEDGGVVISNPSDYHDSPHDIVIAGSYFYTVGEDRSHGELDAQWRIEKRNLSDGALVAEATVNPSPYNDVPFAIATDGVHAYVVGYDRNTTPASASKPGKAKKITPDEQWRIEKRLLSNLSLAASVVNIDPTPGKSDVANDIAIDATYMYVIGYESEESSYFDPMWRIEKRFLSNLGLVPLFGVDGVISGDNYAPGRDDQPTAIAIDDASPCKMYIVGYSGEPENGAQWRYEIRECDTGDPYGILVNDINTYYNDRAYAVAIDNTYVYAAGYYNPGVPDLRIAKRNRLDLLPSFQQPLYPVNSPIPIGVGEAFRLRILLDVGNGPLLQDGQQFRLQYAPSCSGYVDVTDITPIAFRDNPTPLGGTALIGSSEDPVHGGHDTFNQTYEDYKEDDVGSRIYSFTNSVSTIWDGKDGMWDFSLQALSGASVTYCIRVVKDDGTSLTDYLEYPQVTISP
jgi:hypothetical protein